MFSFFDVLSILPDKISVLAGEESSNNMSRGLCDVWTSLTFLLLTNVFGAQREI